MSIPDLDGEAVRTLLTELGNRLTAAGLRGEIFVVGGAAMALVYDGSRTTTDIDAILKPRDLLLTEASAMALTYNLPTNWLNDAVIQMLPNELDECPRNIGEFGGLTVSVASPQYLLALKAMVSRKSPADLDDAAKLCNALGISDEMALEKIVQRYFGTGTVGAQELWFEDIITQAICLMPNPQQLGTPTR